LRLYSRRFISFLAGITTVEMEHRGLGDGRW